MNRLICLFTVVTLVSLCGCTFFGGSQSGGVSEVKVHASDPSVFIMGRVEYRPDGSIRMGYPGVTLKLRFYGSRLLMQAESTQGKSYMNVVVDGEMKKIRIPLVSSDILLFESDVVGEHDVELIHSSETWQGLVSVEAFSISGGGLLANKPAFKRKVLVIGDSISCGEAIDRPSPFDSCGVKDSSWWNPRESFGMKLAQRLEAQVHLVCMGGRGLVRSWNGNVEEQQAPEFYGLSIVADADSVSWDHSDYQADLVLVVLGVNDFSSSAGLMPAYDQYVTIYVEWVQRVLQDHPGAKIVLTDGPLVQGESKAVLLRYLNEVSRLLMNRRVSVLESKHYTGDECDFHPTMQQHGQMVEDFLPHIESLFR